MTIADSMSQSVQQLSTRTEKRLLLSCKESALDTGVSFLRNKEIIVFKDAKGAVKATRNSCKHEMGHFNSASGCRAICPRHGWCLDLSTMTYVNPAGGVKQEELIIERSDDGELCFYDQVNLFWQEHEVSKRTLEAGEFTLRFYAHACAEFLCGGKSLVTDPWLVGPAFSRGWWLLHKPPDNWLDRLAAADVIYISHNHSDHLNVHTLRRLAAVNPNVPVIVPDFSGDSCPRILRDVGMNDIRIVPFMTWIPFGQEGRFMILPDATDREDSGILIEYGGHRVLNTVDSHNLCGGVLPKVDVLLTNFAGGASGFPVCWEQYSEQWIGRYLKKQRANELARVISTIRNVSPQVYIPFAGYFVEAHPADRDVRRVNVKNTAAQVCHAVRKAVAGVSTWIPEPGELFDLGLAKPAERHASNGEGGAPGHDFDEYLQDIQESQSFEPLQTEEGLTRYFEWTGFRENCVLHVIETDESFNTIIREFYIDFLDLSLCKGRPNRDHRYLRMRCRSDVFRHVLRYGLPWEEISIGFQARFFRDPDSYDFEFWDHFQNKLPTDPMPWN
jgi:CMP-N-acetylneuraminate monooxygenase